jgi:hypothetical protein
VSVKLFRVDFNYPLDNCSTTKFIMGTSLRLLSYFLFLFFIPLIPALKFDIVAHPGHEAKSKERCIRNFVAKDQLVVVTAIIDGHRGDGQVVNMHVRRPKTVIKDT